jgi:predicted O-methyltransferase YrrM
MNSLIKHIYETKSVEDDRGNKFDIRSGIKYSEGIALYELIRKRSARETLEIGMAYGLSTLFMCQALSDNGGGRHTAVDPRQDEWHSIGLANIRRAGLEDFFRFFPAPSDLVLSRLVTEGERFDLVFIDGKHLFDYVLVDFYYSDKLIRPGGCIVLHDYWIPAVRKALAFVLANRRFKVVRDAAPTRWSPAVRLAGFFMNLFQNLNDVFSFKLILAPGGRNYCVLEKLADDARLDGHYKLF